MRSHEIDYKIIGDDMQLVEVELDPGETVIAEAGSMCYMEEGIQFETKLGDGSNPNESTFGKLFSAGKRMLSGESLFLTHFTNRGSKKSTVSFASETPGKIIPVNLPDFGGRLLCASDSFLCAALGTRLSIAFTQKFGAGLFGGAGFILQKLEGDGKVFITSGGSFIKINLNNEVLRVDTGCIVAFTVGLDYSIERAGNLKSMLFGGEGLFLATIRGTGTVYLQSLPFNRLADKVIAMIPPKSSTSFDSSDSSSSD